MYIIFIYYILNELPATFSKSTLECEEGSIYNHNIYMLLTGVINYSIYFTMLFALLIFILILYEVCMKLSYDIVEILKALKCILSIVCLYVQLDFVVLLYFYIFLEFYNFM